MGKEGSAAGSGRMPVLFIGHGSPMNMVLDNAFTQSLADLGRSLPRPAAIMVISAHWLTQGTFVACTDRPRMIYDFSGFPHQLYRVEYPCSGAPGYAKRVTDLVGNVRCDRVWGIDHASYSILRHMVPAADIPVFEMSLDYSFSDWHAKPVRYHYELARKLRPLRDEGVLIIGSGNMVHNLRLIEPDIDAEPVAWAREADDTLRSRILAGDHEALVGYPATGGSASRAVPTLDHYLPMIYALALSEDKEPVRFTYEGFQHGSISMRGFSIG